MNADRVDSLDLSSDLREAIDRAPVLSQHPIHLKLR